MRNFFYKGFRSNSACQKLKINNYSAIQNKYKHKAIDGFLIDAGKSGFKIKELFIKHAYFEGGSANSFKCDVGLEKATLGEVIIGKNKSPISPKYGFHAGEGIYQIGKIILNDFDGKSMGVRVRSNVNMEIDTFLFSSDKDIFPFVLVGGKKGEMNIKINHFETKKSPKRNGFFRLQDFNGEKLNCEINILKIPNERPLFVKSLPKDYKSSIRIKRIIGYKKNDWSGNNIKNEILQVDEKY
jgi:hypothetical protein